MLDAAVYRPLPAGWWLGLSDVVDSTEAIAAGRYKAVNMAGAAAISAVMNALGHRDFPFVFGGDGAAFAVPPEARAAAETALARTARWVEEELGLTLRAALVPVEAVRREGREVRVARFAASQAVSYAMFSGQGLAWAEAEMKAGRFAVAPAPAGARPDLTGLSCRWTPIESRRGQIVSLLVAPAGAAEEAAFAEDGACGAGSARRRGAAGPTPCPNAAPASAGRRPAWSWRRAPAARRRPPWPASAASCAC